MRSAVRVVAAFLLVFSCHTIMLRQYDQRERQRTTVAMTTGQKVSNYCEYRMAHENRTAEDGDCYKLLSRRVRSKPAWIFLGDSQMNKLVENTEYPHNVTGRRLPHPGPGTWGRCDLLNYYFTPAGPRRSETWRPPAGGQGPAKYGLSHHWCLDASGAYNRRFATDGREFLEYLSVEYAADVEHQSTETNTSQETAARYLREELYWMNLEREDAVCVVNPGLHDQKYCHGMDEGACLGAYQRNVRSYLALLDSACGNLIWISISSVRGDAIHPQRNPRSEAWNAMVKKTLAAEYPDISFFVDVWNATLHDAVRDGNIHFRSVYYKDLGRLFSSLM